MIKKTWEEFRLTGLLWWINMILHTFGWAIVFETTAGIVTGVYPARVTYRGFSDEDNADGYKEVSAYMCNHADEIYKEAK
jgi:hypothetical protein